MDLAEEKKVQDFLISTIDAGQICAAHDIAEGGLLVALAEMFFEKPELGVDLTIDSIGNSNRLDALLFGESQGRVLVSVSSDNKDEVLRMARENGLSANYLGTSNTTGSFKLSVDGNEILDSSVNKLHKVWSESIPQKMNHN